MGDVQGGFLGLPHNTTPAAVMANKNLVSALTFQGFFIRD